jgi:NADH-quinone oxidoreductase subunit L
MVTAGVFLVCRCSPLFQQSPTALAVVTFIGATTAFFAASVGLFQNDIKRVIAYSTCSQLGYMFAAAGVSAYGAAMFHLFTHAFFKALLFLGAGSVITAMHHEQDMRKMGGLARKIPYTWTMMLIGNLALTGFGIPFAGIGTSGFYSKDGIINATYQAGSGIGTYAFVLTLSAALMTSFYSWRQFLMTFHGRYRGELAGDLPHADAAAHAHDEPHGDHGHGQPLKLESVHEPYWTILAPLFVLAVGALIAGGLFQGSFVGEAASGFWHNSIVSIAGAPGAAREVPWQVEIAPILLTAVGFLIAWYYYVLHPELPPAMAAKQGMLYVFLYHKWYFDELYDLIFVRPAKRLGFLLWKVGDGMIIDGLGPDGVSARVLNATMAAVRLQSGYVYHYAFVMLAGVAVFITWFLFATGKA